MYYLLPDRNSNSNLLSVLFTKRLAERNHIIIVNSTFLKRPQKVKSWEPAYSQALNQNRIDRHETKSRQSGRRTVRRLWSMVFIVETRWELGKEDESGYDLLRRSAFRFE